MKPLDLFSERYGPMGNVASEGVLNQLGRPHLNMLTVLIREAVQNSWDAKRQDADRVCFGISLRRLTKAQQTVLNEVVFPSSPQLSELQGVVTAASPIQVLELWDRGTNGLGGPTRADTTEGAVEPRDFVDFFLNAGHPPDKHLGGGTYGYGKAALYLASRARTICVYSRARYRGDPVERFMASALGGGYYVNGDGPECGRYTGRHWWGRLSSEDAGIGPEAGEVAESLGKALGMPGWTDAAEQGTNIMILDPELMGRTPDQALDLMREALLWYFWPKMISFFGNEPAMKFAIKHEGQTVTIPSPREVAPLSSFVRAMELLKRDPEQAEANPLGAIYEIAAQRPKQHLGRLALLKFPTQKRRLVDTGSENGGAAPFTGSSHHVALMRPAELVVKYLPGPTPAADKIEYAGVFVVDEAVDRVFAEAEPPTHDDWVYEYLGSRPERTFVRVVLRRISESMDAFVELARPGGLAGDTLPLGAFAGSLGALLTGQYGPGAGISKDSDQPGGVSTGKNGRPTAGSTYGETQRGRASVKLLEDVSMMEADNAVLMVARFEVKHANDSLGTLISAFPGVVLDGSAIEVEPPVGAAQPRVVRWRDPEQNTYEADGDQSVIVPAESKGIWEVVMLAPEDVMIQLELRTESIY